MFGLIFKPNNFKLRVEKLHNKIQVIYQYCVRLLNQYDINNAGQTVTHIKKSTHALLFLIFTKFTCKSQIEKVVKRKKKRPTNMKL